MKYEVEVTHPNEDAGWRDWLVISCTDGARVRIEHDYQRPGGDRNTWQDEGSAFGVEHLDEVIGALSKIRASLDCASDGAEGETK